MKKMIFVVVFALCSTMFLSPVALGTQTTASDQSSTAVNMYDPSQQHSALPIAPGDDVGMRFIANASFNMINVACPSWSDDIGNLTFSLYKWDSNFENTITENPIATKTFVNYKDNATLELDFSAQPSGEYVLLLSNAVQSVGVWEDTGNVAHSFVYINGAEISAEFQAQIGYLTVPSVLFGTPKSQIDISNPVTTPPQPQIPSDSPLVTRDAMPDTYTATDALGRTLPVNVTKSTQKDRYVGIFYSDWHASFAHNLKPFNNALTVAQFPSAINDYNASCWPDSSYQCFWDQPLFGYYSTADDWVLRKHAEMLADAGVDVIIFDNTNGTYTWRESYSHILKVFEQARKDGVKTPQIAFLLPFAKGSDSTTQLESLYQDIYRPGNYKDLWFYWKGKPLIMAYKPSYSTNPAAGDVKGHLDLEIANFFNFRPGQPAYNVKNPTPGQWGWLSIYPQPMYKGPDASPEEMTVGIAQNYSKELGLTAMNGTNIFGRAYTSKGVDTEPNAELYGANFAEQFNYAISKDPSFIFITGWNEWTAGRYQTWQGVSNAFPDEFDPMYSRDIEPSAGVLQDNYYYQMVSFIRQYKGTRPMPTASVPKAININDTQKDEWADVAPDYYAYENNIFARDTDGYVGCHYTNTTGRNDITLAKVDEDTDNLYFMVQTKDNLSPKTDKAWMRLLIKVTGDTSPNWEGYQYVINRVSPDATATIERSTGGWNWTKCGSLDYSVNNNVLQIKVPKSVLNLTDTQKVTLDFKWSDNMQNDGNIMDFYQYGDTAPLGRFNYEYTANAASSSSSSSSSAPSTSSTAPSSSTASSSSSTAPSSSSAVSSSPSSAVSATVSSEVTSMQAAAVSSPEASETPSTSVSATTSAASSTSKNPYTGGESAAAASAVLAASALAVMVILKKAKANK